MERCKWKKWVIKEYKKKYVNAAMLSVEINKLILKYIWKCKGEWKLKDEIWRTKLEDFHYQISRFILKL